MTVWEATEAQFSDVLDKAESEGPQVVERNSRRFVMVPAELWTANAAPEVEKNATPMSGKTLWDALRPPPENRFDMDFPRIGEP